METIHFTKGSWEDKLVYGYTRRYELFPEFIAEADHVRNRADPNNEYGFENISVFFPRAIARGGRISTRCRFEGEAAPLIVLAEELERDKNGKLRFGNYIEIVLWKNGINVWRMFYDGNSVTWKKLFGMPYDVDGSEMQEFSAAFEENGITVTHGERSFFLRIEDLPEKYYAGVDACEGICRFYSITAKE